MGRLRFQSDSELELFFEFEARVLEMLVCRRSRMPGGADVLMLIPRRVARGGGSARSGRSPGGTAGAGT